MSRALVVSFGIALFGVGSLGSYTSESLAADLPKQPLLGCSGNLVDMPKRLVPSPDKVPNKGLRIESVRRGGPAAQMGLETGDIVVSVDSMRFSTLDGYRQALRAAGQRPSIVLIDVRTGKLRRKSCSLPHQEPTEDDRKANKPHSYLMAIDLVEDLSRP
jgi:S1-C subfamily serine protease